MPSTFPCPECGEYHYHKSHSKNFYERVRKILLKQRFYRCHRCGYRGWEKRISLSEKFTFKCLIIYIVIIILASFVGILCKSLLL